MRIFRVVLTGGPHAGKTKTYEAIRDHFMKRNDILFFGVPETASELMDNNILGKYLNTVYDFQDIVFQRQSSKEETAFLAAHKQITDKDILIVYDRGLIDNKAYFSHQREFDKLINNYDKSEIVSVDCYDLVIDLITTAGTEYGYVMETNSSRLEDESTAIPLDVKTTQAWLLHENMILVKPKEYIEDKFSEVIGYIDDLIKGKRLLYRQTPVQDFDVRKINRFDDDRSKIINIEDYTLDLRRSDDFIYHVIKREYKGTSSYLLEVSRGTDDIKEVDCLRQISPDLADIFLNQLKVLDIRFMKKLNYYEQGEIRSYEITNNGVRRIENTTYAPKQKCFVKSKKIC